MYTNALLVVGLTSLVQSGFALPIGTSNTDTTASVDVSTPNSNGGLLSARLLNIGLSSKIAIDDSRSKPNSKRDYLDDDDEDGLLKIAAFISALNEETKSKPSRRVGSSSSLNGRDNFAFPALDVGADGKHDTIDEDSKPVTSYILDTGINEGPTDTTRLPTVQVGNEVAAPVNNPKAQELAGDADPVDGVSIGDINTKVEPNTDDTSLQSLSPDSTPGLSVDAGTSADHGSSIISRSVTGFDANTVVIPFPEIPADVEAKAITGSSLKSRFLQSDSDITVDEGAAAGSSRSRLEARVEDLERRVSVLENRQ